jgi:hypothetical protein
MRRVKISYDVGLLFHLSLPHLPSLSPYRENDKTLFSFSESIA